LAGSKGKMKKLKIEELAESSSFFLKIQQGRGFGYALVVFMD
jgi:hypothetical protein